MNLSGSPFDYLIAFFGGVLVSFTPCVYPLIPVSIGYIGVNSSGSKLKGFILGLIYVTGIAITYSALGLLAVLSGRIFGSIAANPFSYIFTGLIITIFGLAMFDIINIPLLSFVKLPVLKQHNYFSTFLLGIASGLIIGPCLTPVLGSILVYLSTKNSIIYGATLLFTFAFGMGLIFIIGGIFSAFLLNLPKSGKWMQQVKRLFAMALVISGLYFIYSGIRKL